MSTLGVRMNFNALPNDAKLYIFGFLSGTDLECTVAQVCTEWETLAHDPTLWRKATINSSEISANKFARELTIFNIKHALELKFVEFYGENLTSFISHHNFRVNARRITFINCVVTSDVISRLFDQCPTVKELSFSSCKINDAMLGDIVKWKNLKKFRINACHCYNEKNWLCRIVNDCRDLVEIEITRSERAVRCKCNFRDYTHPATFISSFRRISQTHLRRLVLDNTSLSDYELDVIFERCPVLKHLDCSNTELLSDRGLSSIISNCRNIESLHLRHNDSITANNILLVPFPLKSLRRLDFFGSPKVTFGDSIQDVPVSTLYPDLEIICSDGTKAKTKVCIYKEIFGHKYIARKLEKLKSGHLLHGMK